MLKGHLHVRRHYQLVSNLGDPVERHGCNDEHLS